MADNTDVAHTGNSHPLLNSVVLERVFKFCDSEDLSNIRSVCTLWHGVTLPRWRNERTLTITIDLEGKEESSRISLTKIESSTLLDVLDELEEPSFCEMPFKSYRLRSWIFSPAATMSFPFLDKLETFFIRCGSWMRELTLITPQSDGVEAFYNVIFKLTPNLKSLAFIGGLKEIDFSWVNENSKSYSREEIGVDDGPIHFQRNLTCLKIIGSRQDCCHVEKALWVNIFLGFPNLKTLEIGNLGQVEINNLATALELIHRTSRTSKIKVLNMGDSVFNLTEATEIVWYSKLELEELHLNMEVHYDDMYAFPIDDHEFLNDWEEDFEEITAISYFIEKQAASLHSLRLSTEGDHDRRFVITRYLFRVSFESLTKLEFEGNIVYKWDFLRFTPNLKSLSILKCKRTRKNLSKQNSSRDLERNGVCVTLPKLEEFRVDFCISIELLAFLGKCMPNVKILKAPLTDETFGVVCENWKEMRELYAVHSDDLGDGGITGFMKGTNFDESYPNIADLKYLRAFSTDSILLSEKSIWNGFLLLPELDLLKVNFSVETSKEAIAALMEKVPNFSQVFQI